MSSTADQHANRPTHSAQAEHAEQTKEEPVVKQQDGDPAHQQGPEPHLPHEADQASANQSIDTEENARTVRQAKDDLDRGLVDTGLAPVVEELDREHFSGRDEHKG